MDVKYGIRGNALLVGVKDTTVLIFLFNSLTGDDSRVILKVTSIAMSEVLI